MEVSGHSGTLMPGWSLGPGAGSRWAFLGTDSPDGCKTVYDACIRQIDAVTSPDEALLCVTGVTHTRTSEFVFLVLP